MIAAISGESIVIAVVTIILVSVVAWILNMMIERTITDPMFKKVALVLLILGSGLFLIDAILRLTGHPIIKW